MNQPSTGAGQLDPVPRVAVGLVFDEAQDAVVHGQLVAVALDVDGAGRERCRAGATLLRRPRGGLALSHAWIGYTLAIESANMLDQRLVRFVGFADEAVVAVLGETAGDAERGFVGPHEVIAADEERQAEQQRLQKFAAAGFLFLRIDAHAGAVFAGQRFAGRVHGVECGETPLGDHHRLASPLLHLADELLGFGQIAGFEIEARVNVERDDVAVLAGDGPDVGRRVAGEPAAEHEVVRVVFADGGGGDGEIFFGDEPVELGGGRGLGDFVGRVVGGELRARSRGAWCSRICRTTGVRCR